MKENHQIRFISQREQNYLPNDSCHVACLNMLLEFSGFFPIPPYEDLCKELKVEQENHDGYDPCLEEMIRFLCRYGINFRLLFHKDEWESSLKKAPIMVAMYGGRRFWGREGHTVVLTGFQNDVFTYLDPWFNSSKNYKKTVYRKILSTLQWICVSDY